MVEAIRFRDFDVFETTGFASELPESLPDYFLPWHQLALKTVELMTSQTMRQEAEKLPLLDSSRLEKYEDLRLAYLQLTVISSGYAWERGPEQLPEMIPACVAIPLCDVADRLGVQPGTSYYSLMCNWQRIDKHGPFTKENLKVRYIMPGGQQYINFITLAISMEISFSEIIPAIQDILNGTKSKDAQEIISGLKQISEWLKRLKELSKGFHTAMQPDVFFTEITLFLRGFNETCGLPEGMLYEGVTDRPRRIVINSAASQTTMFQIIDSLLRTTYPPGKENFFHVLRSTWSAKHRELFNKIKNWAGNLKDIVIQSSNPELTLAYNEVVESVKQFRNYHLQLVTKFTVIPNKRVRNEHNAEGPDPFAYLMPLLKGIRDESAKSVVES